MVAIIAKLVLAVLLAPLSSAIAVGFVLLVGGALLNQEPFDVWTDFHLFATYGLFVSYAFAFCIGVPTNLFLRAIEKNYVWAHTAIGAVVTLVLGFNFFGLGRAFATASTVSLIYSSLIVVSGITVSTVFGLLAGAKWTSAGLDHAT
ncbi:MAG: hypothetical protein AAGC71_14175 [Pseudomonadota bacterium]